MADLPGRLNIDPAVVSSTCELLSAAADHLLTELKALDAAVTDMVSRWTGASGGAYDEAWQLVEPEVYELDVDARRLANVQGVENQLVSRAGGCA